MTSGEMKKNSEKLDKSIDNSIKCAKMTIYVYNSYTNNALNKKQLISLMY